MGRAAGRKKRKGDKMTSETALETIARCGVAPVVVIESAESAIPLADALLEGGLPLVEITFRTAAAAEAIETIRRRRPELLVGAGTLVTAGSIEVATACGARFGVAPGLNPDRVREAKERGLPFVPGVLTPSEIEQALALECTTLKFFPAQAGGGVEMLKLLAAPYGHLGVRFLPTGGVNTTNLASYLALDAVAAAGGTWIATKTDLAEGRWQEIRDRCKTVVEIVAKVRGGG
jgi:2-dehydro-3-deoxyphosphogluconate aldolase / (4S)-4-hydroxy-2-oxoglutarate aldolase